MIGFKSFCIIYDIMDKKMNIEFYDMIFKRKSFHLFRNIGNEKITPWELEKIEETFYNLKPLVNNIKTKIKITKDLKKCKRGQEYVILFYSENKENYLENIGYLGEQLDLYLVSQNIGTLWYGMAQAEEKIDNLEFVIMIAIAKIDNPSKFRKDMYKGKRKCVTEIWNGDYYTDVADIVRFAPSACNTQPWFVDANEKIINVYRYQKEGKSGILPKNKVTYYNAIDIGIFLCFLELCLAKNKIKFNRILFYNQLREEKILTARYELDRSL